MERLVGATKILRSDDKSSLLCDAGFGVLNFKCEFERRPRAGYKLWAPPRSLMRNLGTIGPVCTQ